MILTARTARLVFVWALFMSLRLACAQTPQLDTEDGHKQVPVDLINFETNYVFESDLNHGGKVGEQDALENQFEYGHRFLISGNWYLHLGVSYDRFDFENTPAPVPVHLQSGAAVIGLDYMKGSDIGALIELRPGFYTEEHVGLASFDCPITIARFFILQQDKLYLLVGVNGSLLRGTLPLIPIGGLVWIPSDRLRVMAIPPEPRVIYAINKDFSVWIGGELAGGSYRTDHQDDIVPSKLSGTVVDYVDYRAGAGLVYSPNEWIDINLGGGYSIERDFNFHRADLYYRTDPAPYVRMQIKAKF